MVRQKKEKQKVYNYTVVFEPAQEGGYVVYVPALPGCVTQGDTFEEAQRMARDVIEGYLGVLKDRKEEIPVESGKMIVSRVPATV